MVDLIGRKGGLLLFWGDNFTICKIEKREFSIEVEVEGKDFAGKWWLIFMHLSPENHKRRSQWEELKLRRRAWGQTGAEGRGRAPPVPNFDLECFRFPSHSPCVVTHSLYHLYVF